MKRIWALTLCLALFAGLLGCDIEKGPYMPTGDGLYDDSFTQPSTTRPQNKEQSLALTYYPEESLNPYQATDYTNRVLMPLVYQGLFQVDSKYNAVPILCSGYRTSRDLKTYTFYLEDATFSDGSAVTAADVVASLQAAKESQRYKGRLGYISAITVTDDGGVEIKLSTSYENLPLLLDIPIVKADQVSAERPLGTGPYYYEERLTGLYLLRRTDWWCSADLIVTASYIPLIQAESNAQIRDNFEFGAVSLVCTDPGSPYYVDFHSDYELWACENNVFLYIGCNDKSTVFSNKALRQALTHAIDREKLVETYYLGFAQATTLPASPNSPQYHKVLASQYGYEAAVFAQAVADAQLEGTAVTLLVHKGDSRRVLVAKAIAQMLTDCGLTVTVSAQSGSEYTRALKNGNFDLHLGQTTLSANMDLSAFYSTSGALCYGGMSDAAILAICKEALANSGNYETLYRMVMDDAMLCPVLVRSYAIYVQRGLFDHFTPVRDNLFGYSLGKTLESIRLT